METEKEEYTISWIKKIEESFKIMFEGKGPLSIELTLKQNTCLTQMF
ncbi:MAG: hypothetical protein IKF90_22220 [Parasporobacterium sp.]|nr:hypothetical protein [Parasporobacterium sp.]